MLSRRIVTVGSFGLKKASSHPSGSTSMVVRAFASTKEKGTKEVVSKKKDAPAPSSTSTTSDSGKIGGFSHLVQPKVKLFGLHARYANALYSVAAKENGLESVEKELLSLEEFIKTSHKFAGFLKDPTIARHHKKSDIMGIMKDGKFSKPVAGLFSILAENGRLNETKEVIQTYKKLMSAYRGEVQAKVTSADALSADQLKLVEKALGNHIQAGEKLILSTQVDPEIMGGLQVQVGNMYIDLSIASKIKKIQQVLSQPVA